MLTFADIYSPPRSTDMDQLMNKSEPSEPEPSSGNVERMRRYRARHTRIDYVPAAPALAAIEAGLKMGLNNCLAGVVDRLVLAGFEALTNRGAKP
jgi:hypothetical protein